jgi:hypothetical protein
MTQAYSTRQKGAEASSSRRWAAMEMLSMLKVGYTILRSETPATDLVNTFMDWAARRSLVLLAIFLPPYYIYKLTTSAFAAAVPEDVAGKVALITGASSGIGEVCQPVRSLFCTPIFGEGGTAETMDSHISFHFIFLNNNNNTEDFDYIEDGLVLIVMCNSWLNKR